MDSGYAPLQPGRQRSCPPGPPPPRRFLSASPLGWRSGRMGTREYGKIYDDFPGTGTAA